MKVTKNLLPEIDFINLQNLLLGPHFPWYLNKDGKSGDDPSLNNFQFTHTFYKDNQVHSGFYNELLPLINTINPKSLIRVKANITTVTNEIHHFDMHTDFDYECTTAVFYINSNNSLTVFENGKQNKSIENSLVEFNSLLTHTGTTSTDTKVRCLINLNYFK